jgi:cyclic beta-1,2-glucan synthetase
VRHGWGRSIYRYDNGSLEHSTEIFVPERHPVKISTLRIRNRAQGPRLLSLFAYSRLVLGSEPRTTGIHLVTEQGPQKGMLLAVNRKPGDFTDHVAFAGISTPAPLREVSITADREEFVGRGDSLQKPYALTRPARLAGSVGGGLDPCFAQQVTLEIPPGEEIRVSFLLGCASSRGDAHALLAQYQDAAVIERAREHVLASWRTKLSALQIETPSPALDLMVNGWLAYQTLACRLHAFMHAPPTINREARLDFAISSRTPWRSLSLTPRSLGGSCFFMRHTSSSRGTCCIGGILPRAAEFGRASRTTFSGFRTWRPITSR